MLFAAYAICARLDFSAMVRQGPGPGMGGPGGPGAGGPGGGQERSLPTDREVEEQIQKQTDVTSMMLKLKAGFKPAFWHVLINGVFLFVVAWFVGGHPKLRRTASAVAHATLPIAVQFVIAGSVALASPRVGPEEIGSLATFGALSPSLPEPYARIFTGVDAFTLWSEGLLWLGFAEAAQISRLKAGLTMLVVFPLSLLFWNVVLG
jgi:hypothetical protein